MAVTGTFTSELRDGASAGLRPRLSIVLPAHDEAATIGPTLERIAAVVAADEQLAGQVEVIVISDGSHDDTFGEACRALTRVLPGNVVELATNVGSHAAIRCGLRYATGDHVAIMAADGQDPPELLPAMLREFRAPVDIVWGRRRSRAGDAARTRIVADAYYRMFRLLTGLDYPARGLDFLIVRQRVVQAVLDHSTRNTSVFLMLFNLGFHQAFVDYDRGERQGGSSSWTLRKRLKLAIDMLTSFSAAPIRLVSIAGIVVGLFGICLGGVTLVRAAAGNVPIPGWASLMVVTSVMSGLVLLALGLMGEYVWRTLDEVRRRPLFIEARNERVTPAEDR
jgi:dolichol-phosphate mannosyltransferase